ICRTQIRLGCAFPRSCLRQRKAQARDVIGAARMTRPQQGDAVRGNLSKSLENVHDLKLNPAAEPRRVQTAGPVDNRVDASPKGRSYSQLKAEGLRGEPCLPTPRSSRARAQIPHQRRALLHPGGPNLPRWSKLHRETPAG